MEKLSNELSPDFWRLKFYWAALFNTQILLVDSQCSTDSISVPSSCCFFVFIDKLPAGPLNS